MTTPVGAAGAGRGCGLAKGLPGAAAGTFLGGVTFLALGIAGLGGDCASDSEC
jgi:hypothetical protein